MFLLRSLLFGFVFYIGSVPYVVGAFIGTYTSVPFMRAAVRGWSVFHHWAARWILGIRTEVDGVLPKGAVLFAIKHESMFETIDMPTCSRCRLLSPKANCSISRAGGPPPKHTE